MRQHWRQHLGAWTVGISRNRGYWYFVKRVPKRFAHVDQRVQVRRALWTDSEREARAKAPAVEAEFLAYWEALAAGRANDATAAFEAAKRFSQARGFSYLAASDLAAGSVTEILERIEALIRDGSAPRPLTEAVALLGGADAPTATLSSAFDEFCKFAAPDRLTGKSARQIAKWENHRKRAIRNFVEACGDLPLPEIRRSDAQKFRESLIARIDKGLRQESANKEIGYLADLFRSWSEYHSLNMPNPFEKLRFKLKTRKTTGLPFSNSWIRDKLLVPNALEGLNDEARDVLLVMVNTGARPSEILGCIFDIDAEVPFLAVAESNERQLKTQNAARQIPLLGVSLEAAKRIVKRGGVTHYLDKSDTWSAAVNKYLTENGLRETPKHTAYSLRHSFEDRMTEAGVDDRIRAELMGHKYERPDYGRGGSLELRRKALGPISF